MHPEAMQAIKQIVDELDLADARRVLDVGGRDVNGSPRALFTSPTVVYDTLDVIDDPSLTYVADVRLWSLPMGVETYDVVLCCETFEHMPHWQLALQPMVDALKPGGVLIVTAAANPRAPHSAIDGHLLMPGEYSNVAADFPSDSIEWYENVEPEALYEQMKQALQAAGRVKLHSRGDVYAWGRKPT